MDGLTSEPLAHSASEKNVTPQTYAEHIHGVAEDAQRFGEEVASFIPDETKRSRFVNSVLAAALYHDLGKLCVENQQVLRTNTNDKLPINHVDAGTAHLIQQNNICAALLVYSHHRGLPSLGEEADKGDVYCLRDPEVHDKTDSELGAYLAEHHGCICCETPAMHERPTDFSPLWNRMALSCLVDADHSDTARHYGDAGHLAPKPTQWQVRLKQLNKYVTLLEKKDSASDRTRIRTAIYKACRDALWDSSICSCDSPVGTGKTTAVMAYLLRVAEKKHLRRIFVVLPFVNIINQAVKVYRSAMVGADENPETVIVAHHHRMAFNSRDLRHLAVRWNAPIVVTTAVQFFETLAAHWPSSLRNLHRMAGSAIFIDEAHAALPPHLWPQAWRWLHELAESWGCHIVLGSGSLQKFWTLPEFSEPPSEISELIPDAVRNQAIDFESGRVRYRTRSQPMNKGELVQFILEQPGPRVVIVNTVQSAAVIADTLRQSIGRAHVEHLSTALCPRDREPVVQRVRDRLGNRDDTDWVLVATSCVEAGLDFSFRTAIRESCGLVNLVQIGGRVNRHAEYSVADVWDVRLSDRLLPNHPEFRTSVRVLEELFQENHVGPEWATEAMRQEVRQDPNQRAKELIEREQRWDFPEVARLFQVIASSTITAVVDQDLAGRLERKLPIRWMELQDASVQIWSNKLSVWPLRPVRGQKELLVWSGGYDNFIGYMVGVLPLLQADGEAFII